MTLSTNISSPEDVSTQNTYPYKNIVTALIINHTNTVNTRKKGRYASGKLPIKSTERCLCELTTESLEVYVFSDQAAYRRTREKTPSPHKYLLYETTRPES